MAFWLMLDTSWLDILSGQNSYNYDILLYVIPFLTIVFVFAFSMLSLYAIYPRIVHTKNATFMINGHEMIEV